MKKLAGLVIILVVLVLSAFYGMGVVTEKSIKQGLEVINQSDELNATIEQYHKGWFCSKAQLKWQLHIPERIIKNATGQTQVIPAQDYQAKMPLKIYHGPIIFANKRVYFGMGYAKAAFPFPEQYNAQFNEIFDAKSVKPHLDFSLFVNYLNRSTFELSIPSFKVITKDGTGTIDWSGMKLSHTMSSKADKLAGGLELSPVNVSKDDTKVALSAVSVAYDLHRLSDDLYLGDASFSIPSLNIQVKDEKVFELIDFKLDSKSDGDRNLLNGQMELSLKSVFINHEVYGPGELKIAVRNLDSEAASRMNAQFNAMENGTDAERQKAMIALLPEIPKLLGKGTEFELSQLDLKLPQGTVEGNLFVSFPKGDGANVFELFQKVQGKAKLKLTASVVKQLMRQGLERQILNSPDLQQTLIQQLQTTQPQANQTTLTPQQIATMQTDKRIAALEQNGLVQVEGSDYVIDVTLEQGKFTVNGKPFNDTMLNY